MDKIKLLLAQYLPKELEPGVLYVSEEFGVAGHLCPCGCGSKIITPLGPTEWSFTEYDEKPTLCPSIGNWQLPCRSHYWITDGEIEWSYQWTEEQIIDSRQSEERRKRIYYDKLNLKRRKKTWIPSIIGWIFKRRGEDRDDK
ncbi:MAG: DUF6527 family protein [Bacteroidota bacterium]